MPWRPSALSLVLLAAGCAAPRARFPIGLYGVDKPAHVAAARAAGFDSLHTYEQDPAALEDLAREARKRGLRLVVYPDKLRGGPASRAKRWPIEAWYLVDEPDVLRLSSAAVAELDRATRSWDPGRPTTFVVGQGSAAAAYAAVGDVLMLDWYPVPHLGAGTVADQLDAAFAALPEGKRVWMVLQAYDWADESRKPGLRFPTREELRLMSYLSVLHGAGGLFYFTFAKKGGTLLDHPGLWERVARTAAELRRMRPVFESGRRGPLPYERRPDGAEAGLWRHRGRDYLVLVNRTDGFYKKVPAAALDGWTALFEESRDVRTLTVRIGGAWYLRPRQVLVLRRRLGIIP